MGSIKDPDITQCRLNNNGRFREFDERLKYLGTHLMWDKRDYFHELAIQTAAKGFNSDTLRDHQEMFIEKLKELRWVNGYNDVTDYDFEKISSEWHAVVLELVDDFDADDMYEFDQNTEVMEINVSGFSTDFIDLERIIYYKA